MGTQFAHNRHTICTQSAHNLHTFGTQLAHHNGTQAAHMWLTIGTQSAHICRTIRTESTHRWLAHGTQVATQLAHSLHTTGAQFAHHIGNTQLTSYKVKDHRFSVPSCTWGDIQLFCLCMREIKKRRFLLLHARGRTQTSTNIAYIGAYINTCVFTTYPPPPRLEYNRDILVCHSVLALQRDSAKSSSSLQAASRGGG
jgi:hypothetical protein